MTNHYTFTCQVRGVDAPITHCEQVHSNSMQGNPHLNEDKMCAVAHLCWMCPFRNAVRVGGPWSKPGAKPVWQEPRETAAKLDKAITDYAIAHTRPRQEDYRRAGVSDVGCFDEQFKSLHAARREALQEQQPKRVKQTVRKTLKRPEAEPVDRDVLVQDTRNDMADAVTQLLKEEKRSLSVSQGDERKSAPSQSKQMKSSPTERSERSVSSSAPQKRMSLAERARLMKEKAL